MINTRHHQRGGPPSLRALSLMGLVVLVAIVIIGGIVVGREVQRLTELAQDHQLASGATQKEIQTAVLVERLTRLGDELVSRDDAPGRQLAANAIRALVQQASAGAVPLVAQTALVADELVRLQDSGAPEAQIVAHWSAHRGELGHLVERSSSVIEAQTTRLANASAEVGQRVTFLLAVWGSVSVLVGLGFLIAVRQQLIAPLMQVSERLNNLHDQAATAPPATRARSLEIHQLFEAVDVLRATQAENRSNSELLRLALDGAGDGIWAYESANRQLSLSGQVAQSMGIVVDATDRQSLVPVPDWHRWVHPDSEHALEQAWRQIKTDGHLRVEVRVLRPTQAESWLLFRGMGTSFTGEGRVLRLVGTVTDITTRKAAEASLQLAASVFKNAREGILITDADARIVEVNDTFTTITGYSRQEVLGQNPRILSSGMQGKDFYRHLWAGLVDKGYWSGEIWNRHKSGALFAELVTISAVRGDNGSTKNYVALFSDITAVKEQQRQLEQMAHFDLLTGLPNRVLLADRLRQAMAHAQRQERLLAVVYLDLDGFKNVNDTHGHAAGDHLLLTCAKRMKEALREGDTLARLGGDEFVAVLSDLAHPDDFQPVVERILAAAAMAVPLGGKSSAAVNVSGSAGVVLYPIANVDADQLMRYADQAMYTAKLAGKNRYHLFDPAAASAVQAKQQSVLAVSEALAQRQFVLHYQPKVDIASGEVIGAEALIRWQHPEHGLLYPGSFLPGVENDAVSLALGEWVIEQALSQMTTWQREALPLKVSVNISAAHLQQPDFLAKLAAQLKRWPEAAAHLELEVLETSALEKIDEVSNVMRLCQQMGVRFSLDDFGTGYSSLTYLRRLPANCLKIDQSFVRNMLDDAGDRAIVVGVIGLAQAFGREVIAEGVETVHHAEQLLSMGCRLAQGYGIAKALPPEQMAHWCERWRADPAWLALRSGAAASPGARTKLSLVA